MIDLNDIPEKDRVCVNCIHLGMMMDMGDEKKCKGEMPCLNYHEDNTENFFVPDDDYLMSEYGCDACRNSESEACSTCSRYYSDNWKRG